VYYFSYPCSLTVRLLLTCGADVDVLDANKNTPLHRLVQNDSISDVIIIIIDILCNCGAHLDHVNHKGQTPLDLIPSFQKEVIQYFKEKIGVRSLKCICAGLVQQKYLAYEDLLSTFLINFIQKH